ncbi:hypothetical protein G7046_g6390 [Stylonectria norvegica]|nr:hypothetical protein G7046_g6390 [Stylonectria norvegica]
MLPRIVTTSSASCNAGRRRGHWETSKRKLLLQVLVWSPGSHFLPGYVRWGWGQAKQLPTSTQRREAKDTQSVLRLDHGVSLARSLSIQSTLEVQLHSYCFISSSGLPGSSDHRRAVRAWEYSTLATRQRATVLAQAQLTQTGWHWKHRQRTRQVTQRYFLWSCGCRKNHCAVASRLARPPAIGGHACDLVLWSSPSPCNPGVETPTELRTRLHVDLLRALCQWVTSFADRNQAGREAFSSGEFVLASEPPHLGVYSSSVSSSMLASASTKPPRGSSSKPMCSLKALGVPGYPRQRFWWRALPPTPDPAQRYSTGSRCSGCSGWFLHHVLHNRNPLLCYRPVDTEGPSPVVLERPATAREPLHHTMRQPKGAATNRAWSKHLTRSPKVPGVVSRPR